MIFDASARLSASQAITVTAVSTNVIDLGKPGRVYRASADLNVNPGLGHPINFLMQVDEQFAAAGAATLQLELQSDDNEAFSSVRSIWLSKAYSIAELKPGANLGLVNYLPKGILDVGIERFFRLNYTVATGPFTAGKITAGVVAAVQTNGPLN